MKAFSIIALVLFSLLLFGILGSSSTDEIQGGGFLAAALGIALSISSLVALKKKAPQGAASQTSELEKLFQLKEKGVLTEEEYLRKKTEVLAG